jgi:very-short-patch-repair endonuclease
MPKKNKYPHKSSDFELLKKFHLGKLSIEEAQNPLIKQLPEISHSYGFSNKTEKQLFKLLKNTFPHLKIRHNVFVLGFECDILLTEQKINIEWDLHPSHQEPHKVLYQKQRDEFLRSKGFEVIRIRDMQELDYLIARDLTS